VNVLGCMWSGISTNEDKGVVTSVARVEAYPLASWVVSVLLYIFSLSGGMGYFHWSGYAVKKGGWGCVNGSITILHVWVNNVSKYRDEVEVGEVIEGIISDWNWVC